MFFWGSLKQTITLLTPGAKNWGTSTLCNCSIPNQLTHNKLIYVHFAGSKKTFLEKWTKNEKNWELAVYVQVYLFIILYSHWIATNSIQYLLYLVVLVYEYLSVFTQLYPRKRGWLLYQRIMQPFLRNTRTFLS